MGGRGGELVEAIVATQWEGIRVPGNKATIESRDVFYWPPEVIYATLIGQQSVSYWTNLQELVIGQSHS